MTSTTQPPAAVFVPPQRTPERVSSAVNPLGIRIGTEISTGTPSLVYPAAHGDVTITVALVTPELAGQWLDTYNTHNRNLSKERTRALGRDMEADNWPFTGDPIRFAVGADGIYMADGQHRATAIRDSGVAEPCVVIWGLDDDAQEVIDTGMLRTIANSLGLQKDAEGNKRWSDPASVGTIARRLLLWDNGQVPHLYTSGITRKLTKTEVMRYADQRATEITEAMKVVALLRKNGFTVPGTTIATAYAVLARVDRTGADIFIVEQLIKGIGIDHDDEPAKRLRERLTRTDKWGVTNTGEAFMLVLKAWNQWREGDGRGGPARVQKLQQPRGGWPKPSEWRIR